MSLTRISPSAHRVSSRVTHSYRVLWFPVALITMWNSFYPFACLFVASFAPLEYTKHQSRDHSDYIHGCISRPQHSPWHIIIFQLEFVKCIVEC